MHRECDFHVEEDTPGQSIRMVPQREAGGQPGPGGFRGRACSAELLTVRAAGLLGRPTWCSPPLRWLSGCGI